MEEITNTVDYKQALKEEQNKRDKEGKELALIIILVVLVIVILVLFGLGYMNASAAASMDQVIYPSECHCTVGTLAYSDPTNLYSSMTCSENDYDQVTIPSSARISLFNLGVNNASAAWWLKSVVKQTIIDAKDQEFTISATLVYHNGSSYTDTTGQVISVPATILRVEMSDDYAITAEDADPASKATYWYKQTDEDGDIVLDSDGEPVYIQAELRFFLTANGGGEGVQVSPLYQSSGSGWDASLSAEYKATFNGNYAMQIPMPIFSATWKQDYMCSKGFSARVTVKNTGPYYSNFQLRITKATRRLPGLNTMQQSVDTDGTILTTVSYASSTPTSESNVVTTQQLAPGATATFDTAIGSELQEGDGLTILSDVGFSWLVTIVWYTGSDPDFPNLGDTTFTFTSTMPTEATPENEAWIDQMNAQCLYLGYYTFDAAESTLVSSRSMVGRTFNQSPVWKPVDGQSGSASVSSALYTYPSYYESMKAGGTYQNGLNRGLHAIRWYAPTLFSLSS
jgi:hypothetical protein